jgi:DNA replicative helicase MCM subunit Mcm2 (Cdc46/Mcm family)
MTKLLQILLNDFQDELLEYFTVHSSMGPTDSSSSTSNHISSKISCSSNNPITETTASSFSPFFLQVSKSKALMDWLISSSSLTKSLFASLKSALLQVAARNRVSLHEEMIRFTIESSSSFQATSKLPKTQDVGRFLVFKGTCVRSGMIKMVRTRQEYQCMKCTRRIWAERDPLCYHQIHKPTACIEDCTGTKFALVESSLQDCSNQCVDYQEIRVQEQIGKLGIGTVPRSITVVLEDGLVDTCKAGDDLIMTCSVETRWKKSYESNRYPFHLIKM